MNHESNKSPSLGMISTATRTTATVSPLSPLTNGNVAQSTNSGFAAALRKLAKQAEDPRGSALSGESSPVSSPATSHSSPVSTPKRGSLGPRVAHSRGHGVPSTPPVVTIAPTKTSNGLWRTDGRQAEPVAQGLGREQAATESTHPQQDKRTPPIPSPHPLTHPFGLTPGAIMQDPRIQSLSLPGQMHPVVPSGAVPEQYLRALRPFATSDDLRLTSVPLSLDPAAAAAAAHAAAAAAYYHPAYLHHPLLPRMEESLCLSALRSQFYSVPAGGAFPPLHPSALHLHLPGARYSAELSHTALAERLQMENELRQREREQEREREKERELEAGLEREREREREEERERELDRQKERQRQQQMVRAAESQYLAELQARRAPLEDRTRLTPSRQDKVKESEHFSAPKPLPLNPGLHSSRGSVPPPLPSLVPSHLGKHHAVTGGGIHGALASAMMTHRANEEVWLKRQRDQGQEREGPMELGLRSPGKGAELRRDSHRDDRPHVTWGEKVEGGGRRRAEAPERFPSWNTSDSVYQRQFSSSLHQRSCVLPSVSGTGADLGGQTASLSPGRERRSQGPDSMLVYDDILQQHRRLLSKLDLEEKRRREAREGGYYYDLNESYDESDEEEVKAHLRRVTEQPPLKLDASSEKVEFLGVCGLSTLAHRDELLARKRRKRRRMLRERSPSPSASQGKKKASPPAAGAAPLTTPYTAEQMDSSPELEEKKGFLLMFQLSHIRSGTQELLAAIQRKTVTLDTLRYNSSPLCRSPPRRSVLHRPKHLPHSDVLKPTADSQLARVPPPLASHHDKLGYTETPSTRKPHVLHNGIVASPQRKEPSPVQNGRKRPWERFTPEAFAQHFHQAASPTASLMSPPSPTVPPPHNLSLPKPSTPQQHGHINGHHFPPGSQDAAVPRERLSEEDDDDESEQGEEDEEEEEEEVEEAPRKWQGIEGVFEAYQEYVDEWSIERQVLHSQCKRLEAHNYNLTRTAEQLSLTMGELVSQRQRVREERDRLQAQLEHFRRCLTLPTVHWGRGQVNGHAPR
ncbi:unnamed protein product [Lampetra planeri]